MEMMEVVIPVPTMDFNFDSTCSSPYMTAPSSPHRFGNNFFFSAPTSPSRISSFYRELKKSPSISSSYPARVPFDWEEKPGTPKSRKATQQDQENGDFEFDFSGQLERSSLSADELFDGGKIKPLKPPPGYDPSGSSSVSSPRSSPKSRTKYFDPFQAAIEEMKTQEFPRRRERIARSSNSIRKGSRSLSPLRVSDIMFCPQENSSPNPNLTTNSTTTTTTTTITTITAATTTETSSSAKSGQSSSYAASFLSAISFSKSKGYYRKWKLKDFLLFRSASEGRATIKDPRTAYAVMSKKQESMDDVKNSSFRSTDSSIGSSRRSNKSSVVSAHELHYTVNRAVSEEMKRKTFLPYKRGLLGCLGFNPGMQDLARRVGSLPRG